MTWISVGLAFVVVVLLIRTLVKRPGQGIDRYEFEHWVHSFMQLKKDGGFMTLSHCGSLVFLRIHRDCGLESRCDLLVDVPRASWSESKLQMLRERLDRKCITGVESPNEPDVLLRMRLHVLDIWDPASGALGARVAWELLEVLGLNQQSRFNVTWKGENSIRSWGSISERWKDAKNPALRWIGRSTLKDLEEEARAERCAQHRDSDRGE